MTTVQPELFALMGQKHSISLLLAVAEHPGKPITEYTGKSRTRFLRLKELEDFGLLETVPMGRHNTHEVYLTHRGQKIASLFKEIVKTF